VRLKILGQIADGIIPFHYGQNISRPIGVASSQVVVVDGGWGSCVLADDTAVAKQTEGPGQNECRGYSRAREAEPSVSIITDPEMIIERGLMKGIQN